MALICLAGGLAASFLPETAGSELPETMEEAAEFGKDHGYFSWVMPHHNRAGAKNKVNGCSTHQRNHNFTNRTLKKF